MPGTVKVCMALPKGPRHSPYPDLSLKSKDIYINQKSAWTVLFKGFFIFILNYVYGCGEGCACKRSSHGGQKRALDPLELEFKAMTSCTSWILGTQRGSSVRTLCILFLITQPSLQPPPSGLFYKSCTHRNWRSPEGERWLFWFKKKKKKHPPAHTCKPSSHSNKGNSETWSNLPEFSQPVSKFGSRSPATIFTASRFLTVSNSWWLVMAQGRCEICEMSKKKKSHGSAHFKYLRLLNCCMLATT